MDELLFEEFLEGRVEDLSRVILTSGVCGILHAFELWLGEKGYLREKDERGKEELERVRWEYVERGTNQYCMLVVSKPNLVGGNDHYTRNLFTEEEARALLGEYAAGSLSSLRRINNDANMASVL